MFGQTLHPKPSTLNHAVMPIEHGYLVLVHADVRICLQHQKPYQGYGCCQAGSSMMAGCPAGCHCLMFLVSAQMLSLCPRSRVCQHIVMRA